MIVPLSFNDNYYCVIHTYLYCKGAMIIMREKQKKRITLFVALIVGILSFSLTLSTIAEQKEVKVEEGLLSVKLKEIELTSVLEEISLQTGIKIQIDESVKGKITMEFADIPLEEGLKKLLRGKSWVMVFNRITTPGLPEEYKLQEIGVFPEGEVPFKLSKTDIWDWKTYRNREYEFEIKYPGNFIESDEIEVRFPLEGANVTVFVDEKPSVPLGGTYGGRYP